MPIDPRIGRRSFMHALGAAGFAAMFPEALTGYGAASKEPVRQIAQSGPTPTQKHSIRFAVCGMSHDHIRGMTDAIRRGGGELVLAYGNEPDKIAAFRRRYPDVKWASSEDEILN